MHLAFNRPSAGDAGRRRPSRLAWMSAGGSQAFQLLHRCPVVTADGSLLGHVNGLMVDARTHKPRYVTLHGAGTRAAIALPWQSLYFDSTLAHLVFYTYAEN